MIFGSGLSLIYTVLLAALASASPALDGAELHARQAVDNIVYVTNAQAFWYGHGLYTRITFSHNESLQYDRSTVRRK